MKSNVAHMSGGLVADWLMQDRINKGRAQIDEAIRRVQTILRALLG